MNGFGIFPRLIVGKFSDEMAMFVNIAEMGNI
jgi:hypothetical protein